MAGHVRKLWISAEITFHGQQEQKHQFSQFSWLIPLYPGVILIGESYMLLVLLGSFLRLLISELKQKKINTLQLIAIPFRKGKKI